MPSHTLTRQQLYDEIWSDTMVHVALRYGLSDRGLAKICARFEIPVPPRGYFAKKAHGQTVEQPRLPETTDPYLNRIEIDPPLRQPVIPAADVPQIAFEKRLENRIVVPERLGRTHPLVAKTRAALRQAKPRDRGLLYPRAPSLDICVSRPQVPRALRVMNTLLHALEARRWPISQSTEGYGLVVEVLGEPLSISLDEKANQVPHTPTAWELKNPVWSRLAHDLVPSALLRLRIGDGYGATDLTESKATPLEDLLNRFLIRLAKKAIREKAQREERERWRREQEELERQRREEERLRLEEEKRIKQWGEWMDAWARSQQIKAFAVAVEKAFHPVEAGSRIANWLSWAADYATRLDPLSEAKVARKDERAENL